MVSYSFDSGKHPWTAHDEEENEIIFNSQSTARATDLPEIPHNVNTEGDAEKWPLIHLMRLLRFYGAHRCLWDVNCKDNRNRRLRQAAIVDITSALNIGVTKEQVVQKINILRATYRYEKKRIKQRIRRGLGARTKLKWFALADAFLRNVPKKCQKEEDPSNSDSDLEDNIVFTINPECLMPLDQDFPPEREENKTTSLESRGEIFSQDLSFCNITMETQETENMKTLNKKVTFKRESLENIKNEKTKVEKKSWTFEDTILFLQLLDNNSALLESSLESCEFHQTLLESIAKEMQRSYKSIEKRWYILQKTFNEEKEKLLTNDQYKPKYKWWPQAEKLFMKTLSQKGNSDISDVPTEFVLLRESDNEGSENDDTEYENRFLQNPIPSVAPLSNMTEAVAALFNENNGEEDLSQESNTNSSIHKDNESSHTGKFIWHGLEDDLLEGKWSLKHSVKFLRLYGAHKCLWDLNDPDYRSRPLRNAAIEDIAASMGHGLTVSYVAKKIKIFRITYMQQRKRLLEETEKGKNPEILLKWFPLADSFLRPHIGLRSIKSDAKEIPQFDYQYVYANLNLIDPALLTDFRGKGTQNAIEIGNDLMEDSYDEEI